MTHETHNRLATEHRRNFLQSVPNGGEGLTIQKNPETHPHMKYPRVWEFLGGPNPALLFDYLKWIHADEKRFASATSHMEWFEVGFHGLTLAIATDPKTKRKVTSIQANFYSEEFPGNEDPHGHSRNAKGVWYAHPNSRQITTRSKLLPPDTRPVTDFPIFDVPIVLNCLSPREPGQSSRYNPLTVGEGRIAQLTTTMKAPLSEEIFTSTDVHNIAYEGPAVAVSVHVKGRQESQGLNDLHGLTHYKGLTIPQAEYVLGTIPLTDTSAPRTLILPTRDFTPETLAPTRQHPNEETVRRLLHGALLTAERLAKAA